MSGAPILDRKTTMECLLSAVLALSLLGVVNYQRQSYCFLILSMDTKYLTNPMNDTNASTHGLWATFEAILSQSHCSFKNPFEYDVWLLLFEMGRPSDYFNYNTIKIESKYNLYHNLISSVRSSSSIRKEAGNESSSVNFGRYVIWRKDENLIVESNKGNFLRVTGQLIRSEYKSSLWQGS